VPEHIHIGAGSLQDQLFAKGVEFPCGGTSLCGGCRVRVLDGDVPITPEMREVLSEDELAGGWRLACFAEASGPVTIDVEQWDTLVLSDEAELVVEPREGYGIAVDLGTTTLVAQLLSLATGEVLDVRTGLNPQCRHGADLMTRVEFDLRAPGTLTGLIRDELGRLAGELAGSRPVAEILICGNTVMHHLFAGLSVEPFAAVPFETPHLDGLAWRAAETGWQIAGDPQVTLLPNLGSFVGGDILAGVIACGLHTSASPAALVDLGTNGEIVAGSRDGLVCASTAAGPAFEAGRIRMGMRAAPGAIDRVPEAGRVHVLGGVEPRGICGSGLVDAVAAGLEAGIIRETGRFASSAKEWLLAAPVTLYQSDIRELQLAKGAIAAGLRILSALSAPPQLIHLGGAFGNYVSIPSAQRIGLLTRHPVEAAGNTALRGAKMLLLSAGRRQAAIDHVRRITRHLSLASDARFQERFADSMVLAPLGADC